MALNIYIGWISCIGISSWEMCFLIIRCKLKLVILDCLLWWKDIEIGGLLRVGRRIILRRRYWVKLGMGLKLIYGLWALWCMRLLWVSRRFRLILLIIRIRELSKMRLHSLKRSHSHHNVKTSLKTSSNPTLNTESPSNTYDPMNSSLQLTSLFLYHLTQSQFLHRIHSWSNTDVIRNQWNWQYFLVRLVTLILIFNHLLNQNYRLSKVILTAASIMRIISLWIIKRWHVYFHWTSNCLKPHDC